MSLKLNKLFFFIALIALGIAFCIEIGSNFLKVPEPTRDQLATQIQAEPICEEGCTGNDCCQRPSHEDALKQADEMLESRREDPPRPGLAIPYMALLDGLLFFTVLLMGISLILPERIHGRVQGLATLVVTFLLILGAILMIFIAFTLLLLMFGLFCAVPFGTLAYLAIWGFFDRGGAGAALSLIMLLKLVFCVLLLLAQPRFLQNKGLVLLVLTSLLGNVIVSSLHGIVPGVMVSITDALAAIIVGVIAVIWAIIFFVGSVISVFKSIRLEKESA